MAFAGGNRSIVTCVAIAHQGKYLVYGMALTSVGVWDIETNSFAYKIKDHNRCVLGVDFLSSGALVTWADDKTPRIFGPLSAEGPALIAPLRDHTTEVT